MIRASQLNEYNEELSTDSKENQQKRKSLSTSMKFKKFVRCLVVRKQEAHPKFLTNGPPIQIEKQIIIREPLQQLSMLKNVQIIDSRSDLINISVSLSRMKKDVIPPIREFMNRKMRYRLNGGGALCNSGLKLALYRNKIDALEIYSGSQPQISIAILKYLRHKCNIQAIYLKFGCSRCDFSDLLAIKMCKILHPMRNILKIFKLNISSWQNSIQDEGILSIFNIIAQLNNLKELQLKISFKMNPQYATSFIDKLKCNSSINKLELDFPSCNFVQADELSHFLGMISNICPLDLLSLSIGSKAIKYNQNEKQNILAAIKRISNIKQLDLYLASLIFDKKDIKKLFSFYSKNSFIEKLSLQISVLPSFQTDLDIQQQEQHLINRIKDSKIQFQIVELQEEGNCVILDWISKQYNNLSNSICSLWNQK